MTEIKNIDELPLNSNSNGIYDFLNGSFRKEYQKKKKKKKMNLIYQYQKNWK